MLFKNSSSVKKVSSKNSCIKVAGIRVTGIKAVGIMCIKADTKASVQGSVLSSTCDGTIAWQAVSVSVSEGPILGHELPFEEKGRDDFSLFLLGLADLCSLEERCL